MERTVITVMAVVPSLTSFINHLIHDESCDAPVNYIQNRRFFLRLRHHLESRLLVEQLGDAEEIDDIGEHLINDVVDELMHSMDGFLVRNEIIAVIPLDAKGRVVVVLTPR